MCACGACVPVAGVCLWGSGRRVPIDGIYVCVPPPREACVLMCEKCVPACGIFANVAVGNENYVNVEECGCESVWGFEG